MTGGLIQLVSYGVQDAYLTANPEITFFRFVYKRYTNFSVETIPLQFNNIYEFDKIISCNIPHNGDLINKTYLKIVLPTVSIPKSTTVDTSTETLQLNVYKTEITNFNSFIDYVYESIRKVNADIDKDNIKISDVKTTVDNYLSSSSVMNSFVDAKNTQSIEIQTKYDIVQIITDVDALSATQGVKKTTLKKKIKNLNKQAILHSEGLMDNYISKNAEINTKTRDAYKFAWVDNIGYKILEYVEIYIGGIRIDQQYGEWLHVWNEINRTTYSREIIDKISGNVSTLKTYDNTTKDEYTLLVPLKFWFNIYSGCALPLIASRYESIELAIKTSKLRDCIYTDCTDDALLTKYVSLTNIELMVDYIFLSEAERDIFSNSKVEYLIEQNTYTTYLLNSVNSEQYITVDLEHPTKYMVWSTQINDYITKYNLHHRYDVFTSTTSSGLSTSVYPTITDNSSIHNPTTSTIINLNTYNLTPKLNNDYYNYVVPWELFGKTPSDGINCYSFSLNPLHEQPHGSCNLSRIDETRLVFKLNSTFLTNADSSDLLVKLHTINYNVLKFHKGSTKLIF